MTMLGRGLGIPIRNKFSGGAVDPGLALLQSATLWLDASNPGSDSQVAANRGTGGTALDARYGSTTGVDTNDPLLLTHTGTNYLYLPGSGGNFASTPDLAAYSPTDWDMRVRVALTDWTPGAYQTFISHGWGTGSQSYLFAMDSGNQITLLIEDSGGVEGVTAGTLPTVTDGNYLDVRVTRRNSDARVQFFTKSVSTALSENTGWTQLGTDKTMGLNPFNSTSTLQLGATSGGANQMTGRMQRAMLHNGIDGAVVFDADFTANTNQSSFTESSSNAATVTINRSTSGRKAVMVVRPTWLFGTDDYLEVADNALLDIDTNEQMTVIVAHREWATPVANSCFVTKFTGNFDEGWSMLRIAAATHQIRAFLESGASNITAASGTTYSAGSYGLRGIQIDRVAQTALGTEGSTVGTTTSISGLGTFVNAAALRIGANGGAVGSFTDMELTNVAIFKGTLLSSAQLGQIATYLGV